MAVSSGASGATAYRARTFGPSGVNCRLSSGGGVNGGRRLRIEGASTKVALITKSASLRAMSDRVKGSERMTRREWNVRATRTPS